VGGLSGEHDHRAGRGDLDQPSPLAGHQPGAGRGRFRLRLANATVPYSLSLSKPGYSTLNVGGVRVPARKETRRNFDMMSEQAAIAAGFSGVIVHGLLQTAGVVAAASRDTEGSRPFDKARVRFRSPLLPATPATVALGREGPVVEAELVSAEETHLTARIELSDE
jgi:hypothetical protein